MEYKQKSTYSFNGIFHSTLASLSIIPPELPNISCRMQFPVLETATFESRGFDVYGQLLIRRVAEYDDAQHVDGRKELRDAF